MGPKKVRTPEEEAAYQEERRVAKREAMRRLRADPEHRARAAAAKRRRRVEDREFQSRERESRRLNARRRRGGDPSHAKASTVRKSCRRAQTPVRSLYESGSLADSCDSLPDRIGSSSRVRDHIPAVAACSRQNYCSRTMQAVIPTINAGTQCSLGRLTCAAACQTDDPERHLQFRSPSGISYLISRGTNPGADGGGCDGAVEYACATCKQRFGYKGSLLRHLFSPAGCKPYACGRCRARFAHRSGLAQHERLRAGCRLYTCGVCGQGFTHNCNLARHRARFHAGPRCHVCGVCGKGFVQKKHLVEHERSHSGRKPHVCGVCGKSYTVRWSLVRHEWRHSAPYARGFRAAEPVSLPGGGLVGQEVPAQTADLVDIIPPCVTLETVGLSPISP